MEVKLDIKLHGLIIENARCPNLKEMLEKLHARVEVFRVRQAIDSQRAKNALREHIGILDAIIAGKKTAADKELQNHIEHTKNNVLSTFKKEI